MRKALATALLSKGKVADDDSDVQFVVYGLPKTGKEVEVGVASVAPPTGPARCLWLKAASSCTEALVPRTCAGCVARSRRGIRAARCDAATAAAIQPATAWVWV